MLIRSCSPQSAACGAWPDEPARRALNLYWKDVAMKPQCAQALVLAATLVAGAIACETTLSGGAATPAIGRPECPSDSFAINVVDTVRRGRTAVIQPRTITVIPLAGPITNVPEFHDCQQLIKDKGYLALYAIFASFQLNKLVDSLDTLAYTITKRAFPAAEIYSNDTHEYAPLAIKPYFNCLYLYRDKSQWRANMVSIGKDEKDCSKPLVNPATAGTELKVLPISPKMNDDAYPPVARWDWDSAHGEQYIGIQCGTAWCEVGSQQFAPMPAMTSGPAFDPIQGFTATPEQSAQVYGIKGWYDEQQLAVPGTNGLQPGVVHGIIIPNPVLDQLNQATDFHPVTGKPWVHVATAVVNGSYSSKLHFSGGNNKIYLCYGTATECGVSAAPTCPPPADGKWWAKITSRRWPWPFWLWHNAAYRCVTQRLHPGVTIPGTVRWRWAVNDETGWIRCTNGCCTVN